jgi:hypothetical protein
MTNLLQSVDATVRARFRSFVTASGVLAMSAVDAKHEFEYAYLSEQLRRCRGNVIKLAEKTGYERTHLYRKLRDLGIDPKEVRHTEKTYHIIGPCGGYFTGDLREGKAVFGVLSEAMELSESEKDEELKAPYVPEGCAAREIT